MNREHLFLSSYKLSQNYEIKYNLKKKKIKNEKRFCFRE